ncbi:hypothetical protein BST91_02700 [Nonlabens tegetincola]|uniref:hypothetical protein n=1 Tax=Nonlabens tegetincola TaxID=323273 RepID=UPI000A20991E|nr:hypothetical protein [Nonlabens tegetincola]ARN70632.1 hypothetical protein BST91_02700 [Nonlabens tegetincola]
MPEVNYIKHLNGVFGQFQKDSRLNPTHISLYVALFQYWNFHRFAGQFQIHRDEVMKLAKLGSKNTYHKNLKDLHNWGYLIYLPSHNPFKGSKIKMLNFDTSVVQPMGQPVTNSVPNSVQALGPIYKHKKTKETDINEINRSNPKNEQDVIDFFLENNWPAVEAQKFYNHYQANGWRIGGKIQMQDWNASAKKWMLKHQEEVSVRAQSRTNGLEAQSLKTASEERSERNALNLHTNRNKNYDEPL